MENEKPRLLKPSEMDVRISTISQSGASLLIYKDARVDMDILDEWKGWNNWKREHLRDNANCIVSVWDAGKNQWISKEDTGTESREEKEKGLASDSFKRACFNFGIGRELYTAPFIWVKPLDDKEFYKNEKTTKLTTRTKFHVSEIVYNEDREIVSIKITDNRGNVRYGGSAPTVKVPTRQTTKIEPQQPTELSALLVEVEKCETEARLKELWIDNITFQGNAKFKDEVNKKKLTFRN